MPRITKQDKLRNHDAIVDAAGVRFRRHGVRGVNVADVMGDAGLSHGGFYNHFADKEALVVEALRTSFAESVARIEEWSGDEQSSDAAVAGYVSPAHRESPTGCCASISMAADVARSADPEAGRAYADGLTDLIDALARTRTAEGELGTEQATATLCEMAGALLLSWACSTGNPELSTRLLDTAGGELRHRLGGAD